MIHFGAVDEPLPDWRLALLTADEPDDDEERPTPKDVVALLGFDPAEPEG